LSIPFWYFLNVHAFSTLTCGPFTVFALAAGAESGFLGAMMEARVVRLSVVVSVEVDAVGVRVVMW
jgi:threonine/homoserine/homoserine lactone efflux protein